VPEIHRNGGDAMAFVPVPNTCEVVIDASLWGEDCKNIFYFRKTGTWDDTDLQALVDALFPVWGTFASTYYNSGYVLQAIRARDLRTTPGFQAVTDDAAVAGTVAAPVEPNNAAIAVARRSGLSGRNARGRIFLPVSVDANTTGANSITTTFRDAILAMLDAFHAEATTLGWEGVIVSRVAAGVPLTTAVVYSIVEWVLVNTVIDSMRRRLPG